MHRRLRLGIFATSLAGWIVSAQLSPALSLTLAQGYSSGFINRYISGCVKQVKAQGKSLDEAKQVCQCSLQQIQQQHSQSDAIVILMKAQLSSITDPQTGLPRALTPYFSTCIS